MPDMDFDAGRKRRNETAGFIMGGERFGVHDVHPDEVNGYIAKPVPDSQAETQEQIDEFVAAFLDDDGRERWKALRARRDDPVTYGDLLALSRWLLEQHAERPTMPPARSGGGRPTTPGTSEVPSPSPVVTTAA